MARGKGKGQGWHGEPKRHAAAARGEKTVTATLERVSGQKRAAAKRVEDKAYRLEEIQGEMDDLLEEAFGLLRGTQEQEAARGYWYAHIKGALDKDESGFLGGSMIDMAQTIEGLESEASDLRLEAAGPGEGGPVREMIRFLESLDEPGAHAAVNKLRRFADSGNQDALRDAINRIKDESDRDWYNRRQRDRLFEMADALDDMVRS